MKHTVELLHDIVDAINSIETYLVSSYDVFLEDHKTQDAIMFNLVVIGEAASKISHVYQEEHPEIPWSSMIGTRNVIVHGYDQIKLQIVWDILHKDLQPLKKSLLNLLD